MNTTNIACSTDENALPQCAAMICSLLDNARDPSKIFLIVMHSDLKQESQKKMKRLVSEYNASLKFVNLDQDFFQKLEAHLGPEHIRIPTLYRLVLPEKARNLDKILYLDCDIIVKSQIEDLFWKNLGENLLGAVEIPFQKKTKLNKIGLSGSDKYFNAGVLLINCEKWRSENITKKIMAYIRKNNNSLEIADQDSLNYVAKNNWRELGFKWNVRNAFYTQYTHKLLGMSKKEFRQILSDPYIIHFAGKTKPWDKYSSHPKRKDYLYYLNKTPWKNRAKKENNVILICLSKLKTLLINARIWPRIKKAV